ncbi:retrovirus-related pol polyprotein from transposon TNT 1-94 [Tanacetum coccineum]|uniref:ATP-dependent DNA helicase n=1 Tax=Tanacetum coccineum TaxID=301880 RepID=A0ABQ4YX47_9ASTR
MGISKADQIALDDALVAPANRLKIGKCNLRLSSDVTSKEATLQVVYDVLKLTPFYKAFQVSADVPEIYMQEFWASAYIHNRSVRFKMNNKKHILNLDQFRDILQICPKVGNEKFEEPPLEKEILAFLASLGHSGEIRKITDVNVNKLHQPWRSFAAIINKCLSGKTSYDSLRLSQAQILWGMYNNKKVDYAYLLWEDFIYQIENKNTKKGNAMYYPRFTKLIVNFVMAKDPSIPRRNKVNWHYARDDPMFTTINVISRNEDTQLYGTILPAELTNEDIRNSESYKEYYAIASGKIPPKTKASKKKADSDATTKQKPPTVPKDKKGKKTGKGKQTAKELETIFEAILTEAEQLNIITKRSRKETHNSHASGSGADEGTGVSPGVPDAPDYDSDDDISWKSSEDGQDVKNEDSSGGKVQMKNEESSGGKVLIETALMNDRRCLETLDRTLRDVLNALDISFGGKSVMLSGDFRKTVLVKKARDGKVGEPDEANGQNTFWINIPLKYCIPDNEHAFGKNWKEKHVNCARFGKKQDEDTRLGFTVHEDRVRICCDAVRSEQRRRHNDL